MSDPTRALVLWVGPGWSSGMSHQAMTPPPPWHEFRDALSVRARKALLKLGVAMRDDPYAALCSFSGGEIAELRNCGASTVREIQRSLERHGLSLRGGV